MDSNYQFEIKELKFTHTFIDVYGDTPDEVKVTFSYNIQVATLDGKCWRVGSFNTRAEAEAAIGTIDWPAEEEKCRAYEERKLEWEREYRLKREKINAQRRARRKK